MLGIYLLKVHYLCPRESFFDEIALNEKISKNPSYYSDLGDMQPPYKEFEIIYTKFEWLTL